jgi:hypothetical protein
MGRIRPKALAGWCGPAGPTNGAARCVHGPREQRTCGGAATGGEQRNEVWRRQ